MIGNLVEGSACHDDLRLASEIFRMDLQSVSIPSVLLQNVTPNQGTIQELLPPGRGGSKVRTQILWRMICCMSRSDNLASPLQRGHNSWMML